MPATGTPSLLASQQRSDAIEAAIERDPTLVSHSDR